MNSVRGGDRRGLVVIAWRRGVSEAEIEQAGGGGVEANGPMGPPAPVAEREADGTGAHKPSAESDHDAAKTALTGDGSGAGMARESALTDGAAGDEAALDAGHIESLSAEHTASNHAVVEQPLPLPKGRGGGAMGIDSPTAIAVGVVIGGLAIVAWMRGRTGRPRANSTGAVRAGATGEDVEQTAIALAALVREADARIVELTRLREEIAAMGAASGIDRTPHSAGADAFRSASRRAFEQPAMGRATHGAAANGADAMLGTGSTAAQGSFTGANAHAAQGACADPVAGRVYELADSGLSAVQIASMLHEHTGKIELILALRRSVVARR